MNRRPPPHRRASERGHLMAGLLVAITIMLIFSGITFQAWDQVVRRDNEAEMMFRAQDIVRAIQRYRQGHGGQAPLKLKDLMEPGPKGQYYLRRLYKDPLVEDGLWGVLFAGPGGQIVDPGAKQSSGEEGKLGTSIIDERSALHPDSPFNRGSAVPGADPRRSQQDLAERGRGATRAPRQSIAGMRIAGVKSLCTDKPFRVYRGFSDYSQWLFTYFDLEAPQAGGQPGAGPGRAGPGSRGGRGGLGGRGGRGAAGGGRGNPPGRGSRDRGGGSR